MTTTTLNIIRGLWGMARPAQVVSVVLVFVLGVVASLAFGYTADLTALIWAVAAVLPVTISVHYVNEYADAETDALTVRTPYSGGSGVLPSGIVPRMLPLQAALLLAMVGTGIQLAAVLTGAHGWLSFVVMFVIMVLGWAYSMPPISLAWRGFGEIDNALLGGTLMPIYGFLVFSPIIEPLFVLALVPFTMVDFVNLLATQWPDRIADAAVGKYTLPTQLKPSTLRIVYCGVATAAFLLLGGLLLTPIPTPVIIGGLAALPLIIWGAVTFTRQEDPTPTVWGMTVMLLGHLAGWWLAI